MTQEEYSKATFFLQSRRYNEGLKYIQTLLVDSPNDDICYSFLAGYYTKLNQLKKAEENIETAISLNPVDYAHYKSAVHIQVQQQKPKEANKYLSTAISLNPLDPDLFGYKGVILIAQHNYTEALTITDEGLKLDPCNEKVLKARAMALSLLKRNEEAKEITNRLLKESPNDARSLFTDGFVSLMDGEDSTEALASSLAMQPNNVHFKNAYRLALRDKLPGFLPLKKWAMGAGEKGSTFLKVTFNLYILFFVFSILIYFTLLSTKANTDMYWITAYLLFWNIGIVTRLSTGIFFSLYDIWLFIRNRKSRVLYSKSLIVNLLSIITLLLTAIILSLNAAITTSINSYHLALHIFTLIIFTQQIGHANGSGNKWKIGYSIFVLISLVASIYLFDIYFKVFIFANIAFRILANFHTALTVFVLRENSK